jgi:hypothetical protein
LQDYVLQIGQGLANTPHGSAADRIRRLKFNQKNQTIKESKRGAIACANLASVEYTGGTPSIPTTY